MILWMLLSRSKRIFVINRRIESSGGWDYMLYHTSVVVSIERVEK